MTLSIICGKKCHNFIIPIAEILTFPDNFVSINIRPVLKIMQICRSARYSDVSLKYNVIMFDLSEGNDVFLR